MVTLVLVHSPFVGPGSLRPLAARLTADGIATYVPDLRAAVTEPPVLDQLAAAFAAALSTVDDPLVLVGHSGAGPLLPAFAATQPRVEALVFLDAELRPPVAAGTSRRRPRSPRTCWRTPTGRGWRPGTAGSTRPRWPSWYRTGGCGPISPRRSRRWRAPS